MFRSTNVPFDQCSIRPIFHSTGVLFDQSSFDESAFDESVFNESTPTLFADGSMRASWGPQCLSLNKTPTFRLRKERILFSVNQIGFCTGNRGMYHV